MSSDVTVGRCCEHSKRSILFLNELFQITHSHQCSISAIPGFDSFSQCSLKPWKKKLILSSSTGIDPRSDADCHPSSFSNHRSKVNLPHHHITSGEVTNENIKKRPEKQRWTVREKTKNPSLKLTFAAFTSSWGWLIRQMNLKISHWLLSRKLFYTSFTV